MAESTFGFGALPATADVIMTNEWGECEEEEEERTIRKQNKKKKFMKKEGNRAPSINSNSHSQ